MSKQTMSGSGRRNDESKTSPLIKIVLILTIVCVLAVLAFSLLKSTGAIKRMATAYTVDGEKISAMEMNLHYFDIRSNMVNNLQSYGQQVDADFDNEKCMLDETKTWKEYFVETAKTQAKQIAVLCAEGKAAGYKMTDSDKQQLDNYIAGVKKDADKYDMSVNSYLSAVYGAGTKLSDVQSLYEKRFYANGFYKSQHDGFQFSDDEINKYYEENKNTYDLVDAYYYSFPYTEYTFTEGAEVKDGQPKSKDEATKMTDASKADAKSKADAALAQITTADTFDKAVKAVAEDQKFSTGFNRGLALSKIAGTTRGTWFADASRAAGDKAALENATDKSYDVVFFVDRYRDTKQAATVRHILFMTKQPGENATDEEKAAIKESNDKRLSDLNALWEEWKADGASEEKFAALAAKKSEDEGSTSNGGMYEKFGEGSMVPAFNDWTFDKSRKSGDTGIVETDYGYHLIYFVSNDGEYWYFDALNALRDKSYEEWFTKTSEKYKTSDTSFGIKMVGDMTV